MHLVGWTALRRVSVVALTYAALCVPVWSYDGAALFTKKCADCHGELGQGTDYHSAPLAGDLPIRELARVISETMPEGDAASCTGEEAEAIARYAHEAFYSPLAQARVRPPRRELARLTGRQLRQSLADLVSEFRGSKKLGEEQGLRVVYSSRQKFNKENRLADRIEPRLYVSFAGSSFLPDEVREPPSQKDVEDSKASARRLDAILSASGSVLAPTTGLYEFIVRSPNGFSLELNEETLIDGRIRSGDSPELRGQIWLVGGRAYPLSISARRTRAADLRLALLWKPPQGVKEVIPSRYLSPVKAPKVHATSIRFPPDDRSVGYVRGSSISAAWDEAATAAALETARTVLSDLPDLAKLDKDAKQVDPQKAKQFSRRFAEGAFRRPLTESETETYIERFYQPHADAEPSAEESLEFSLLAVLRSPRFLYPEAGAAMAPADKRVDYAIAMRLALGLWDSLPNARLRQVASEGKLANPQFAHREAVRMLQDLRARSKLSEFFAHWLRLDHAGQLSRDPKAFPDFNQRVAADMRASLDLFLEDVVWNGSGDLRELFLSEELYVNHRLAEFLDLEKPNSDPEQFSKAAVETRERAGLISHPYLVTAFSYYRETSPIHRGVFLARNMLGRSLRPPPEAVAPLAPELAPEMTTRERVAAQTSPDACQACHVLINDLGFTLEHFDAVGRYREAEGDQPIDASGGYIATDGGTFRLDGARGLAHFLADSEDVHRSFVTQLFEHVTKQPILAYGVETRERLLADFRANEFNIPDLLCDIAVTAAFAD